MNKQEVIEKYLKKNYLISPDFFDNYDDNDELVFDMMTKSKPLVINQDLFLLLKKNNKIVEINWIEFEKSRAMLEKGRDDKIYSSFLNILSYDSNVENKTTINKIIEEIKKPESIILVEKDNFGHTENFIPVKINQNAAEGSIVSAVLSTIDGKQMIGHLS